MLIGVILKLETNMNPNRKITIVLSKKIKIISFIIMVLVVFIHSYNLGYSGFQAPNNRDLNFNHLVQNFISQGIARIAVPLFFCISGVFYFIKFELSLKIYLNNIKKRFKTLIIPYISWSIIGLLIYFLLQINPITNKYFPGGNDSIINYSFNKILEVIFIHPIPFQLWFIRDLFILILLSPFIEILNKYSKGYWLVILLIVWFFKLPVLPIIQTGSLLFFSIGGFIVKNKFEFIVKKFSFATALMSFALWVLLNLFLSIIHTDSFNIYFDLLHKIGIIIGIFSIWTIYDYIYKFNEFYFSNSILQMTFFLFVTHEPLLTIVRKLLLTMIGTSELRLLIVYFSSAIAVIVISIYVGLLMRKYFAGLYFVLTGGR